MKETDVTASVPFYMVLTFGNMLMFYVSLNEINKDGKGKEKIYKTEQT